MTENKPGFPEGKNRYFSTEKAKKCPGRAGREVSEGSRSGNEVDILNNLNGIPLDGMDI
jgi:hypothetical protein